MNFLKNDKFDALYNRYLISYGLTETSRRKTGDIVYDYYLDFLLKQFKLEHKTILSEDKRYKKYLIKKSKIFKKREKYKYEIIDDKIVKKGYSSLVYLPLGKKYGDNFKFKRDYKLYRLKMKYERYVIKYSDVIPKDKYEEEMKDF